MPANSQNETPPVDVLVPPSAANLPNPVVIQQNFPDAPGDNCVKSCCCGSARAFLGNIILGIAGFFAAIAIGCIIDDNENGKNNPAAIAFGTIALIAAVPGVICRTWDCGFFSRNRNAHDDLEMAYLNPTTH